MYTYLHNPRCSKSRQGLQLLNEKKVDFKVREYLKDPLDSNEIISLSEKLNLPVLKFTRTKESVYKDCLDEKELIDLMAKNPVLMERPILYDNDKATVGRPPENFLEIL
ncbi:MAG: arsenate reductase family protein [Bdellovibrionales bacterium]|jgi:arsenate reductase|nr:arsenate reductase family protein [Bdellovibrionales bacterium]